MPGRELTSIGVTPIGATHDLPLDSANPKDSEGKRGPRRGSLRWYRRLVEYFYERRKPMEAFWKVVDEKYRNTEWETGSEDKLQINQIGLGRVFAQVHLTETMVFSSRPEFKVEGWTGKINATLAPYLEQGLNNEWWRNPRIVRENRLAVRDCEKYGIGFNMTTYEPIEEDMSAEQAEEIADQKKMQRAVDPTGAAITDQVTNEISAVSAEMPQEEPQETFEGDDRILRGQVSTRHVSAWDALIDPDCTHPEDARWVGYRVVADLDFIDADPMLTSVRGIEPDAISRVDQNRPNERDPEKLKSPYRFVYVYLIWERQPGGRWHRCIFTMTGRGFLRAPEEETTWLGHPFSVLRWNEDGQEIFPQSDLMPQWGLVLAEELVSNKALDGHLRENFDITLVPRGMLSEETFNGLIGNGEVGYYGEYDDPTGQPMEDIRRKIFRPETKPKSPETLNFLAMLERQQTVVSGLGNNQLGAANKSDTSATEASEIAGFARARGSYKFAAVEEFVADVAQKRLALMARYFNKGDVRRIIGDEAAEHWPAHSFDRADIKAGLRVIVTPGSMRPKSNDVEAQMLMQLLQVFAQNPALLAMLNVQEWGKRFAQTRGFKDGDPLIVQQSQEDFVRMLAMMQGSTPGAGGGGPSKPSEGGANGAGGVAQQTMGPLMGAQR